MARSSSADSSLHGVTRRPAVQSHGFEKIETGVIGMFLKKFKPHIKSLLRKLGIRRAWPTWYDAQDNPDASDVLESFGLFGLIVTWREADVIEATVRNAFAQGCERVFLVDNESPDDTVERALAAGAELAASFATTQHDEVVKIRTLNDAVARVSAEDGRDHIWWLWLDADEFVHGPRGLTVREYLSGLDRRFRIVGSRYFNHFPDRKPEAIPGFHPLDFQPLCEELSEDNFCSLGHRKHHLQRFDRAGPPITARVGFHRTMCEATLIEPTEGCFTHHFPYREESTTRGRVSALTGGKDSGSARIGKRDNDEYRAAGHVSDMSKRARTLDHVYGQSWSEVENLRRKGRRVGVAPKSWTELVDPAHAVSARWYTEGELVEAQTSWSGSVTVPETGSRTPE